MRRPPQPSPPLDPAAEAHPRASIARARGLCESYSGGARALDGRGFAVEAGSIVALLGPIGAGTSTVVEILAPLPRPDASVAPVAGHDVLRAPDRVRRARASHISQRSIRGGQGPAWSSRWSRSCGWSATSTTCRATSAASSATSSC